MELSGIENYEKSEYKYYCESCDFKCSYRCDWKRHISTSKHQVSQEGNKMELKNEKKTSNFICDCGRSYSTKSNLGKHKKLCKKLISPEHNAMAEQMKNMFTPELVFQLIQQNKELQQLLLTHHTTNNSHNTTNSHNSVHNDNSHSHNKTFNLQIFLNETCKDAINMSDFIKNIKVTLEDLEETSRVGYAEGISKLFIKNLNELDVTDRPIHCSDLKRETMYIKNDDVWSKEDDSRPAITTAIKEVAYKNLKQVAEWQKKYPGYRDPESRDSDKYQKMLFNSISGSTEEESNKNYNKIIRNIAKEVTIDK